MDLLTDIRHKRVKAAVIGLGYVGLPMCRAIVGSGLNCVGFDISASRVRMIQSGSSPVDDVTDAEVRELLEGGLFTATDDASLLASADVVLICVPTPIDRWKTPDLSCVVSASRTIADNPKRGQLVILESTSYPGTTVEVVKPILEERGMVAGRDFQLAFSPERIDPGNKDFAVCDIPKIVGGLTSYCGDCAEAFYSLFVKRIVRVSSPSTAEMAKIHENVFRCVNIAYVNELALLCDRMGIDVWEVIEAAATKPFGFMKFYPGPGLGGHCIPVDPYYLAWKARDYGFHMRFTELAASINDSMPYHVVYRIASLLNTQCKSLNSSRVLVLGVTYKKDVADLRESPALKIIPLLINEGAEVIYHDPYIPRLVVESVDRNDETFELDSVDLTDELIASVDCCVIITAHSGLPYDRIVRLCNGVLDTRNALKEFPTAANVVKL